MYCRWLIGKGFVRLSGLWNWLAEASWVEGRVVSECEMLQFRGHEGHWNHRYNRGHQDRQSGNHRQSQRLARRRAQGHVLEPG
jgi:hypothetical protein